MASLARPPVGQTSQKRQLRSGTQNKSLVPFEALCIWNLCGTKREPSDGESRKFYFDGGQVEIVAHLVHELDPNGKQLRVVRYTDYAADTVRTLCPSAQDLRKRWADADQRAEIIAAISSKQLAPDQLVYFRFPKLDKKTSRAVPPAPPMAGHPLGTGRARR